MDRQVKTKIRTNPWTSVGSYSVMTVQMDIQGQAEWGPVQPGLVEDATTRSTGVGLDDL